MNLIGMPLTKYNIMRVIPEGLYVPKITLAFRNLYLTPMKYRVIDIGIWMTDWRV